MPRWLGNDFQYCREGTFSFQAVLHGGNHLPQGMGGIVAGPRFHHVFTPGVGTTGESPEWANRHSDFH